MSAGAAAVGLRLRQERLKRGWSQEGLCRGICAASYLSKIEQGRVQAAPELLALLMKRLDLPWYGENLPELEGLVERRYAQLLDGEQEAFQDSRAAFSQALETILSSPLAADGLVLDAVDRQDPSDIPAALEPYLDRRQLALLRIVQDREPEAVRLLPEAYCFLMAGIAGYEQGGDYTGAMAYLRQGCDLAARDGRVRLMLECRLIMGGVCCNQLDLDGMEEHYRAAERMARALGRQEDLRAMAYNRAATQVECGRYQEAYGYFSAGHGAAQAGGVLRGAGPDPGGSGRPGPGGDGPGGVSGPDSVHEDLRAGAAQAGKPRLSAGPGLRRGADGRVPPLPEGAAHRIRGVPPALGAGMAHRRAAV